MAKIVRTGLTSENHLEYGGGTITKVTEGDKTMAAYKHISDNKKVAYYLNCKNVILRGGKEQMIYYFSKDERADTGCDLPDGMCVNENKRNGFLTLKRGPRNADNTCAV